MSNMKYYLLLLFPILLTSCLKNCITGSGDIVSQDITIENNSFTKVLLSSSYNINIEEGTELKMTARGHANILEKLDLRIVNNQLRADLQSGNYCNFDLEIDIVMPSLTEAKLDGSGNFSIGQFNEDIFTAEIEGSGDILIDDMTANKVTAHINGSGNIEIDGTCVSEDLSIDGSGNINSFDLNSSISTALIQGSGNIELSASQTLDATIEGSGNIYYRGNPIITQNINGSGNLIQD